MFFEDHMIYRKVYQNIMKNDDIVQISGFQESGTSFDTLMDGN